MENLQRLFVFFIILVVDFRGVLSGGFEECLRQDSISCIQIEVFQIAKSFFDKSNLDVAGISVNNRRGKSFQERLALEEKVNSSHDVIKRQAAIEDYILTQIRNLWNDMSVTWNPKETARSLSDIVNVENNNLNGEARGKAKKQLKILLPLLIGIKLKLATFAAISYMIIAVIAKKAVFAGLISLMVSGFLAAKNIVEAKYANHHATPYYAGYDPSSLWAHSSAVYEHDLTGQHQHQHATYVKSDKQ